MAIPIKDGSGNPVTLKSTTDGPNGEVPHHRIDASVLPTGAATETTLAAVNAKTAALVSGNTPVVVAVPLPAGTNNIGKVEITSQTLPTGAATETTLAAVNAKLPVLVNTRLPVVIGTALPPGANNIGGVDIQAMPALPAGTNVIGKVEITSQTLPTGAASETTLAAMSAKLPSLVGGRIPVEDITSGGILSATTSGTGSGWVSYASQTCRALDIVNTSGTDINYRRNGSGAWIKIPDNSGRVVLGITNASQVSIQRTDVSNVQVGVSAEWLA